MFRIRKSVVIAGLAAAMIMLSGYRSALAQNQADDSGPDPAAANMAPVDGLGAQPDAQQQPAPVGQGTNEAITAAQTASPTDQTAQQPDQQQVQQPPDQNMQAPANPDNPTDQAVDQGYAAVDDSNSVDYDNAAVQSDQPPPPLPDYEQPPLPGDGYIWTPGYWAWSPDAGYYWVPGAWVMPPYVDALWTPGWWSFYNGQYYFFAGYWGPYIGYYGGINYGFGYIGRGYEGGYWRDHRFHYNSAVNIIRIGNVSVYSHAVASPSARYSFNGPGGARLRPAPAELNAMRRPRVAPMSTQVQMQRDAQQNRGQFANANHGRPAAIAAPHPIAADTHTQPLPPARILQQRQQPAQGYQQGQQQRPAQQQPQNFSRPAAQPVPQQTLQARPVPEQEPQRQFQMQPRPEQQQQFTPQSQPRPAPQQQVQPRPEPQPEQRPENFSRPAPQPAPQAQPRPQQQPQSRPEPAPQSRPAPQQEGHGNDHSHQ